jgi:hypothetical protein
MILNKELVVYLDKLYWVYRKVKQEQIKEDYVQDIKEFWNCDVVVKHKNQTDNSLLFLRLIDDAEIVLD